MAGRPHRDGVTLDKNSPSKKPCILMPFRCTAGLPRLIDNMDPSFSGHSSRHPQFFDRRNNFYEQIKQLKQENFQLRLKIYILEKQLAGITDHGELRIDVEVEFRMELLRRDQELEEAWKKANEFEHKYIEAKRKLNNQEEGVTSNCQSLSDNIKELEDAIEAKDQEIKGLLKSCEILERSKKKKNIIIWKLIKKFKKLRKKNEDHSSDDLSTEVSPTELLQIVDDNEYQECDLQSNENNLAELQLESESERDLWRELQEISDNNRYLEEDIVKLTQLCTQHEKEAELSKERLQNLKASYHADTQELKRLLTAKEEQLQEKIIKIEDMEKKLNSLEGMIENEGFSKVKLSHDEQPVLDESNDKVSGLRRKIEELEKEVQEECNRKMMIREQKNILQEHMEKLARFMQRLIDNRSRLDSSEDDSASLELLSQASSCLEQTRILSHNMRQESLGWEPYDMSQMTDVSFAPNNHFGLESTRFPEQLDDPDTRKSSENKRGTQEGHGSDVRSSSSHLLMSSNVDAGKHMLEEELIHLKDTLSGRNDMLNDVRNAMQIELQNVETLTTEVNRLNERAFEDNNVIQNLQQQLKQTQEDNSKLKDDFDSSESMCSQLVEELKGLKDKLQHLHDVCSRYEQESEDFNSQKEAMTRQNKDLENKVESQTNHIAVLDAKNKDIEQNLEQVQLHNQKLAEENSVILLKLMDKRSNSEIKEKLSEANFEQLKKSNDNLEDHLSESQDTIARLLSQIHDLQQRNSITEAQLQTKMCEIQVEKSEVISEKEELLPKLASMKKENISLEKDLQKLKDVVLEKEIIISNLQNQLQSVLRKMSKRDSTDLEKGLVLEEKVSAFDEATVQTTDHIGSLNSCIITLQNENTVLKNDIANMEKKIEKMEMTMEELDGTIDEKNLEIYDVKQQLRNKNVKEITDLRKEIEQLTIKLNTSKNQLSTLRGECKEKDTRINQLEAEIQSCTIAWDSETALNEQKNLHEINDLKTQIFQLKNELLSLQDANNELTKENKENSNSLAQLLKEIQDTQLQQITIENQHIKVIASFESSIAMHELDESNLKDQLEKLQMSYEDKTAELNTLKSQMEEGNAMHQRQEMQGTIDHMEKVNELKLRASTVGIEHNILKDSLSNLQREITKKDETIKELKDELENKLLLHKEEIDVKNFELNTLEQNLSKMKSEKLLLSDALSRSERDCEGKTDLINQLETELEANNQCWEEQVKKIEKEGSETLGNLRRSSDTVQKERTILKECMFELEKENEGKTLEVEESSREIENTKALLESLEKEKTTNLDKINSLNAELSNLQNENNLLNGNINTVEENSKLQKIIIEQLQTEVEDLCNTNRELRADIEKQLVVEKTYSLTNEASFKSDMHALKCELSDLKRVHHKTIWKKDFFLVTKTALIELLNKDLENAKQSIADLQAKVNGYEVKIVDQEKQLYKSQEELSTLEDKERELCERISEYTSETTDIRANLIQLQHVHENELNERQDVGVQAVLMEPMEGVQRAVSIKPRKDVQQTVSMKPTENAQQTFSVRPLGEVQGTIAVEPLRELHQAVSVEPLEEVQQTIFVKPLEEVQRTVPAESLKGMQQAVPVESLKGMQQTVPAESLKGMQQAVPAESLEGMQQTVPVESLKGMQQAVPVESLKGMQQVVPVESLEEVQQTVSYIKETVISKLLEVKTSKILKLEQLIRQQQTEAEDQHRHLAELCASNKELSGTVFDLKCDLQKKMKLIDQLSADLKKKTSHDSDTNSKATESVKAIKDKSSIMEIPTSHLSKTASDVATPAIGRSSSEIQIDIQHVLKDVCTCLDFQEKNATIVDLQTQQKSLQNTIHSMDVTLQDLQCDLQQCVLNKEKLLSENKTLLHELSVQRFELEKLKNEIQEKSVQSQPQLTDAVVQTESIHEINLVLNEIISRLDGDETLDIINLFEQKMHYETKLSSMNLTLQNLQNSLQESLRNENSFSDEIKTLENTLLSKESALQDITNQLEVVKKQCYEKESLFLELQERFEQQKFELSVPKVPEVIAESPQNSISQKEQIPSSSTVAEEFERNISIPETTLVTVLDSTDVGTETAEFNEQFLASEVSHLLDDMFLTLGDEEKNALISNFKKKLHIMVLKLTDLQSVVADCKVIGKKQQNEVARLKDELSLRDSELAQLHSDHQNNKLTIDDLHEKYTEEVNRNKQLSKDNQEKSHAISLLETQVNEQAQLIEQLSIELQEYSQRFSSAECSRLSSLNADLQQNLDVSTDMSSISFNSLKDKAVNYYKETSDTVYQVMDDVIDKVETREKITRDLDQYQETIRSLQWKLKQVENDKADLLDNMAKFEHEILHKNSEYDRILREYNSIQDSFSKQAVLVSELEKQIRDKTASNQQLLSEMQAQTAIAEQLSADLQNSSQHATKLEMCVDQLKQDLGEKSQLIAELTADLEAKTTETNTRSGSETKENLTSKITSDETLPEDSEISLQRSVDIQTECADVEEQIIVLQQQNYAKTNEVNVLQEKLSTLGAELKRLEEMLVIKNSEMDDVCNELADVKEKLFQNNSLEMRERCAEQSQIIEQLEKNIQEKTDLVTKLLRDMTRKSSLTDHQSKDQQNLSFASSLRKSESRSQSEASSSDVGYVTFANVSQSSKEALNQSRGRLNKILSDPGLASVSDSDFVLHDIITPTFSDFAAQTEDCKEFERQTSSILEDHKDLVAELQFKREKINNLELNMFAKEKTFLREIANLKSEILLKDSYINKLCNQLSDIKTSPDPYLRLSHSASTHTQGVSDKSEVDHTISCIVSKVQIDENTGNISRLQDAINKLENERNSTCTVMTVLQQNLKDSAVKEEKLLRDIAELQHELTAKDFEAKKFQDIIDTLKQECVRKSDHIVELERKSKEDAIELIKQDQRKEIILKDSTNFLEASDKREVDQALHDVVFELEIDEKTALISKLRNTLIKSQAEIHAKNIEVKNLQKQLLDIVIKEKGILTEIAILKHQLDVKDSDVVKSRDIINDLQERYDKRQEDIDDLERKSNLLSEANHKLKSDNQEQLKLIYHLRGNADILDKVEADAILHRIVSQLEKEEESGNIARLQEAIHNLKNKLNKKTIKIENLQEKLQDHLINKESLLKSLEKLQQEVTVKGIELTKGTEIINILQQDCDVKNEVIADLEHKCQVLSEAKSTNEEQAKMADVCEVETLKNEDLKSPESAMADHQNIIGRFDVSDALSCIVSKVDDDSEKTIAVSRLRDILSKMENEINFKTEEIKKLQQRLQEGVYRETDLLTGVAQLKHELLIKDSEVAKRQNVINSLQQDCETKNVFIADLERKFQMLSEQSEFDYQGNSTSTSNIQEKMLEHSTSTGPMLLDNPQASDKIEVDYAIYRIISKVEYNEKSTIISKLQETVNILQNNMNSKTQELKNYVNDIAKLKQEIVAKGSELLKSQDFITKLQRDCEMKSACIVDLEHELRTLPPLNVGLDHQEGSTLTCDLQEKTLEHSTSTRSVLVDNQEIFNKLEVDHALYHIVSKVEYNEKIAIVPKLQETLGALQNDMNIKTKDLKHLQKKLQDYVNDIGKLKHEIVVRDSEISKGQGFINVLRQDCEDKNVLISELERKCQLQSHQLNMEKQEQSKTPADHQEKFRKAVSVDDHILDKFEIDHTIYCIVSKVEYNEKITTVSQLQDSLSIIEQEMNLKNKEIQGLLQRLKDYSVREENLLMNIAKLKHELIVKESEVKQGHDIIKMKNELIADLEQNNQMQSEAIYELELNNQKQTRLISHLQEKSSSETSSHEEFRQTVKPDVEENETSSTSKKHTTYETLCAELRRNSIILQERGNKVEELESQVRDLKLQLQASVASASKFHLSPIPKSVITKMSERRTSSLMPQVDLKKMSIETQKGDTVIPQLLAEQQSKNQLLNPEQHVRNSEVREVVSSMNVQEKNRLQEKDSFSIKTLREQLKEQGLLHQAEMNKNEYLLNIKDEKIQELARENSLLKSSIPNGQPDHRESTENRKSILIKELEKQMEKRNNEFKEISLKLQRKKSLLEAKDARIKSLTQEVSEMKSILRNRSSRQQSLFRTILQESAQSNEAEQLLKLFSATKQSLGRNILNMQSRIFPEMSALCERNKSISNCIASSYVRHHSAIESLISDLSTDNAQDVKQQFSLSLQVDVELLTFVRHLLKYYIIPFGKVKTDKELKRVQKDYLEVLDTRYRKDPVLGSPRVDDAKSDSSPLIDGTNIENFQGYDDEVLEACAADTSPCYRSREKLDSLNACNEHDLSATEVQRSNYSSPDLGIESDPNQEHVFQEPSNLPAPCKGLAFVKPGALGDQMCAVVVLKEYELLKKEIAECLVGMKAISTRAFDGMKAFKAQASPKKMVEYTTLKGILDSCNNVEMCLHQGEKIIDNFWCASYPFAAESLNALLDENKKLKEKLLEMVGLQEGTKRQLEEQRRKNEDRRLKMVKHLNQTKVVMKKANKKLEDDLNGYKS